MTDFKKSFNIGLEAAARAEQNRREVDEVFEALNRDLYEVSSGSISIERDSELEPLNLTGNFANFMNRKTREVLVVKFVHEGTAQKRTIAIWSQDINGYPCTIKFQDDTAYCDDKDGLAAVLANLLEDAWVGQVIYGFLQRIHNDEEEIDSDDE